MAERLSEPQRLLLAEIRDSSTGGLYIDRYRRYYRTAVALERRGLVVRKYADPRHDWFQVVPAASANG